MRWYTRKNKSKVWADTYGKPFAMRHALACIQADQITINAQIQIGSIQAATNVNYDELFSENKAMAVANAVADTALSVAKIFHKASKDAQ